MLNLNYNINDAVGGGNGCRGEVKFNYSASIVVVGAGGGGATDTLAGGGGGGAMAVSQSISVVPNITYQINVGGGGAVDNDGQDSSLVGYDDVDNIPISFYAGGGKKGTGGSATIGAGGNSGTGSIVRNGITTSYPGFTGGTVYYTTNGFGPQKGAGGGASNAANGQNGNAVANQGGNGGSGYTAGGGGGASFIGPTGPLGYAGAVGSSEPGGYGVGGNGYSAMQNAASNPRQATAGANGVVFISYPGKQKALVTGNVTSSFVDGVTTHVFSSGSGTFTYVIPYPWEEPVIPYTIEVCPNEHNEDVRPEIYWDYSYVSNLNRFPFVAPFVSSSYTTMSINAVNSNCINVTTTNNSNFTTDAQSMVTPSLTGSNWPRTGSVTMSISVAGITYDPLAVNQFYSSSFSASAAVYNSNPSITGSIISSSFLASEFYRFYVNANVVHNYGTSIPTGGLIQWLDASDPLSYPGSGSVWYDLSPYGHNASASFGSTFPTWSNSTFNFNGTSDTVTSLFTSSLSAFSLVVWAKIASLTPPFSSSSGGALSLASASAEPANPSKVNVKFDSLTFDENREDRWEIATEQNNRDVTSSLQETAASLQEYVMISMTNAGLNGSQKLYRNTTLVGSGSNGSNYLAGTGSLMIVGNRYYPNEQAPGYAPEGFFTGSIIGTLIYNRELSTNEIIDIFNAGI